MSVIRKSDSRWGATFPAWGNVWRRVLGHPGLALTLVSAGALLLVLPLPPGPRAAAGLIFLSVGTGLLLGMQTRQADELARARRAAEVSEESKMLFLSSVSHEFRTPLNAVIGFSEFLMELEGAASDQRRGEYLQLIHTQGRQLMGVVEDCLELARSRGGHRPPLSKVDMTPLLGEMRLGVSKLAADRDTELSVVIPASGPPMMSNSGSLERILLNFLTNAIKYGGGQVRLEADLLPDAWLITVTDNGCGLDADQQKAMFEPFNRLGREAGAIEGTGLGLAIAADCAALIGARIEVDSEVGVGTRMKLRVPIARPRGENAKVSCDSSPAAGGRELAEIA